MIPYRPVGRVRAKYVGGPDGRALCSDDERHHYARPHRRGRSRTPPSIGSPPGLACQVMRLTSQLLATPWGLEPAMATGASWKIVLGTEWPQIPPGLAAPAL